MDKLEAEFNYWKHQVVNEKELNNNHFEYFYTTHFNLNKEFYHRKRIIDIGCGPRGSLEWCNGAKERIGIDPLVDKYMELNQEHSMKYITACSEDIPFPDNHFDIVSSFNSLNHVNNLNDSISEIIRITKIGGIVLILVDIMSFKTITEPIEISWSLDKEFKSFKVIEKKHYVSNEEGMYQSINDKNLIIECPERGILSLKLYKENGKEKI